MPQTGNIYKFWERQPSLVSLCNMCGTLGPQPLRWVCVKILRLLFSTALTCTFHSACSCFIYECILWKSTVQVMMHWWWHPQFACLPLVAQHERCIVSFPQCNKMAFSLIGSTSFFINTPTQLHTFPSLGYCNSSYDVIMFQEILEDNLQPIFLSGK